MGDLFGSSRSSSAPSSTDFLDDPRFLLPSGSQGEDRYEGGMDFANDYGPDLSYEPEELPGSEMDAPSELPTFSDYLQLYGSKALDAYGSYKKPKKRVIQGGRLSSSGYSGPSGRGGGYRPASGGFTPKEYLTALQYEKLMDQRLKEALAEMVRNYKINPLV